MPQPLRVVPAEVRNSGLSVDDHAHGLHGCVRSTLSEMEAAKDGVPAQASVVIAAATAKWEADHFAMLNRLIEFGGGLQAFADVTLHVDHANTAEFHRGAAVDSVRDAK